MQPSTAFLAVAAILWVPVAHAPAVASQGDQLSRPSIEKKDFGKTPDGTPVELYILKNSKGMTAKVITYGAILTELHVPDKSGKTTDVVLGFGDLQGYLAGNPHFGTTVGRVANRIAKGTFTLDAKEYTLAKNNGQNAIHGGLKGFDKVVWKAKPRSNAGTLPTDPISEGPNAAVEFTYLSPDGEEGYPGNLNVAVTYTLTDQNELRITYLAKPDKATPVNLTNHSYFNLAGADQSGDILGHELKIEATHYTPTDEALIPTGEIKPVKGTPVDFTIPTLIGSRIEHFKKFPGGYDHNFVLNNGGQLAVAAFVRDPKSGREMTMLTTEPAVQLYTGNGLNGKLKGKGGIAYGKYHGICLEAQHYPDSVHHASFPSVIVRPGKTYHQVTAYRFSAR